MIFKSADLIRPSEYGTVTDITREFTRLVLGIQLTIAGSVLPMKYVRKEWLSILILLVPVMSSMWIISGLIIFLCIPELRFVCYIVMNQFFPLILTLSIVVAGRSDHGSMCHTH